MPVHLLLVDDSAAIRSLIRKIVSLAGFRTPICLEAANGQAALELLCQYPVDVIVTDIEMPLSDGSELLERLRDDPACRAIPVIVVAAALGHRQRALLSAYGVRVVIQKPFHPEEVRNALVEATGARSDEESRSDPMDSDGRDF